MAETARGTKVAFAVLKEMISAKIAKEDWTPKVMELVF